MSDQTTTTAPNPAVDEAARSMGWRPLEEFRGDASKWVDASTFVQRGEHFLPIIRKDRDDLRRDNEELKSQLQEVKSLLKNSTEAIASLREYQTQATENAVKKARADWIANLKDARERGDVDAEIAAQSEITKIDSALAAPKETTKPTTAEPTAPAAPQIDPELKEWVKDNPWYESDRKKRALAHAIAEELRADPANKTLLGRAFYNEIAKQVNQYTAERPTPSKVAGGRAGGGSGAATKSMTYNDLPEDAKAACDRYARQLVGPGRAFKDAASWQAKYAADYFAQE